MVNQIPGITGAGATIVTRDALGRSIATTVPLRDTRLLARGLSSYSVEAGFVRRRFSVRSFDYDAPAVSASGRYGLDDALTLEGHAESAPGVYNLGGRVGQAGRGGRGQRFAGRQRGPLRGRDQPGLPVRAASSSAWTCCHLMMGDRTQARVGQPPAAPGQLQRRAAFGGHEGGAGWSVQRGRSGGQAYTQGQAQYLGRYGQLTGLARPGRTHAGGGPGLGSADGRVTPSRRINDSFALVSTARDVDVLHENRKLGKTDSSGHLLVPDLIPYQANRVSIDVENLPVDTRLESTKAVVVPQSRSGVVANFQLERYVAATVILKTPDGQFLPPGAGVLHAERQARVVGYDGMTFVEDLQALNHLTVQGKGVSCRAQFEYGAEPDA